MAERWNGSPGRGCPAATGTKRYLMGRRPRSGHIVCAAMGIRTTVPSGLVTRQGVSEGAGSPTADRLGVGMLTALVAFGYSVFVIAQYSTFKESADDLLIFDEAVRSYAHFKPGISLFFNLHFRGRFSPSMPLLGDHFSPILAVLAPLYWIYDSPETLLVAEAVLFALAIPPLWIFTRRAFGGGGKATAAAYLVSVAYAVSWPVASALAFNFHEVAFTAPLMAVALERLQAGRLRSALIALGVLLLVKEDMGLLVAGIGVYLAVSRQQVSRQRLVAVALIVGGMAYTWIATDVLIPAFGGRANWYWAYDSLGPNVSQATWHAITHPVAAVRLFFTPRVKLDTMLWLFGAFCFLPLLSPISLAAVPLLLERMLSSTPNWWGVPFQYNAFLVVVLACAAVDGAARLDRWAARGRRQLAARRERSEGDPGAPSISRGTGMAGLACGIILCAVGLCLIPRFAFGPALQPSFYHRNARERAAAAADALVPSGVTVEATPLLGPQLSARDTVALLDGEGGTPPFWGQWVVADVRSRQFTWRSVSDQRQRVALLERHGYQVVFSRHGYVVLHRVGSGSSTADQPKGRGA